MFEDLENKPVSDNNQVNNPNTPLLGSMPSEKMPTGGDKTGKFALAVDESEQAMNDFEKKMEGLYDKGQKRGRRYSVIGIVGSLVILIVMSAVGYYLWSQVKDISKKVESREQDTINLLAASSTRQETVDQTELSLSMPAEWKSCVSDSDCAETQADCCSCNSGGTQTAINKNYLVNWQAEIDNSCLDVVCMMPMNCKGGASICDNGQCVFLINEETASSTEQDIAASSTTEIIASSSDITAKVEPKTVIDSDSDGLIDDEESRYGTDLNNPDTDGDGYKDGDEVDGGYNPLGAGKL